MVECWWEEIKEMGDFLAWGVTGLAEGGWGVQ
jgi:hypothetical protein